MHVPAYNSPIGVAAVIVAYVIVMGVCGFFAMRRFTQKYIEIQAMFARYLKSRGWEPISLLPALAQGTRFTSIDVEAPQFTGYSCLHAFHSNGATLYLGVSSQGEGRFAKRNTVALMASELRAPVDCLIATDFRAPEAFHEGFDIRKIEISDSCCPLFVHFKVGSKANEAEKRTTLEVVDLVFGAAPSSLGSASVGILGPRGLFIRGPVLSNTSKGHTSGEEIIPGSEFLLNRCREVWAINAALTNTAHLKS